MKNKKRILLLTLLALLTVLLVGSLVYVADFYTADAKALEALKSDSVVTVEHLGDQIIFSPARPEAGFIFYPGGKVEHTAYAPLMSALARKNILCVLVQMPANLAVLDPNAADGIPEQFPEIEKWYIGGHSLGGSMAASYAEKNSQLFRGLVLLASYSTADLTGTDLDVLSIYGSEDGVLNQEKYAENLSNLPEDSYEIVIRGGNHAFFGSYGLQDGDGLAGISPGEQLTLTAAYLHTFFT